MARRIWDALRTFESSPVRSALWIQTLCGMELTANEALGLQTPEQWQNRRQELQEMGGPPVDSGGRVRNEGRGTRREETEDPG